MVCTDQLVIAVYVELTRPRQVEHGPRLHDAIALNDDTDGVLQSSSSELCQRKEPYLPTSDSKRVSVTTIPSRTCGPSFNFRAIVSMISRIAAACDSGDLVSDEPEATDGFEFPESGVVCCGAVGPALAGDVRRLGV